MAINDDILTDATERMEKAIEVLKKNLSGIRTGRANPGLVDSLRVDVYGSPQPIKQIASVGAPEPTQIVIRPYDPSVIKEIEKASWAATLVLIRKVMVEWFVSTSHHSPRMSEKRWSHESRSFPKKPKSRFGIFAETETRRPNKLKKIRKSPKINETISRTIFRS